MQDYLKHAKLNTLKLPNRKKQETTNKTVCKIKICFGSSKMSLYMFVWIVVYLFVCATLSLC